MTSLARSILVSILLILFVLPAASMAQQTETRYSEAEIDQLLAPIALYPDVLLSQILMASTYPLEVVQAARWSQRNRGLEGEAAVNAVAGEDWDPSVKALVAFPQVLAHMDEDLDWTQRLGEAFLFQEEEVMDRVQILRQRAYEAGSLQGLQHVRVSRDREVIIIEPASPQLVYVPYYNPQLIYGGWWWPSYQPYYWAPSAGLHLGVGFYWGGGIRVAPGFFYSTVHWPQRHIVIVQQYRPFYLYGYRTHRDYYASFGRAHKWRHDARHRRGIAYGHGGRPPPQIGRPPAQSQQRPSILRETGGQERRQQGSAAVQRQERQRSTQQIGRPGDSADRVVPINPTRTTGPQRGADDRRSVLRPSAAPSQQQRRSLSGDSGGGSSIQFGREANGGGSSSGGGSQERGSILR